MNPSWRKDYLRYKSYLLDVLGHYKRRKDLKVYLEIFLTLAAISIFAVFALRPTLLTIAELIKEIDAKKIVIEKMDKKISNLTTAQEIYAAQQQNINLLDSAMPSTPKPESYERQIENLVVKNSIALNSVAIDKAKLVGTNKKTKDLESSNHNIFTTTLAVKGTYQSLDKFMADLINLLRPINIEVFNMSTPPPADQSDLLNLTLDIKVPYVEQE